MAPRRQLSSLSLPSAAALPLLLLLLPCAECRPTGGSGNILLDANELMAEEVVYQVTFLATGRDPPFTKYDPGAGLTGFEIELLGAVCEASGLDCPLITAPYAEAWPDSPYGYMGDGMRHGNFDCALGSGNTAPRNATLLFSYPYTERETPKLVMRKQDPYILPVGTCGVVRGSSCNERVMAGLMTRTSFSQYEDVDIMMGQLRSGQISAAVICGEARATAAMNPSTEVIVDNFTTAEPASEGLGFMCHPKKSLQVSLLNLGLRLVRVKDSGTFFSSLCEKHKVKCDYDRTSGVTGDLPLGASHGVRAAWPRPAAAGLLAAAAAAAALAQAAAPR